MTTTRSDVLILGAGAVGLSTAHALLQRGIRSTILERLEPGAGSSLRNAGYVCPSHFVPLAAPGMIAQGVRWMLNPASPFYVRLRPDWDLIRWGILFWRSSTGAHVHRSMGLLRDLCTRGLSLYEQLAADPSLDFDLQKRGLLILFRTAKGEAGCAEEVHLAHSIGVEAELLNRTGLEQREPGIAFAALGGAFYPGDAHLDPEKFLRSLTAHLESRGVDIARGAGVVRMTVTSGGEMTVVTTRGTYAARNVILAGGAWSPGIVKSLGIRLPMQPGKGYSMTIPRPAKTPLTPMILAEERVALTPFRTSFRLGGTMEVGGFTLDVTRRRAQAIIDAVPRYLPECDVREANPAEAWAGLRPVSPDGLPYIGRFRRFPNLIAATGHAMLGLTLAPVTGSLVADLITGVRPPVELAALSPDRFS
jgi:D-amino-acid dehydrogenase